MAVGVGVRYKGRLVVIERYDFDVKVSPWHKLIWQVDWRDEDPGHGSARPQQGLMLTFSTVTWGLKLWYAV